MFATIREKIRQNRQWFLLALVLVLAILLRWPALELPIDNDGGARAYHARLILAGEPLYSTHHPGHHLPAIYYIYAFAFFLFGDAPLSIQLFLMLWTVPTLYFLYRLGTRLTDRPTALLALVFYAVLSAHVRLWGQTAETELFANLLRITAVLALLYLTDKDAPAWQFVSVGLLGVATFLFKAVYLSPLAMAGYVFLVTLSRKKWQADAWRCVIGRGLWVVLGVVVGLLSVVIYFGVLGLLPRLLQVFTLGQGLVSELDVPPDAIPFFGNWILYPLFPLLGLALNNAALLIFSLAGFLMILLHKQYRRQASLAFLAVWYVLSFVEAGVNLEIFAHYYLLIVPPLSLLAAWFIRNLFHNLKSQIKKKERESLALAFVLLLCFVALSMSAAQNFSYYYHYVRYKMGQETVAEFAAQGWPGFGERLARSVELARYVREHTHTNDYIFYWSEDVQLYYLVDRRIPIEFIWPKKIVATGSYKRIFVPATKYVIVDKHRKRKPDAPAWLYKELSSQYELETIIDRQLIYRRVTRPES